MILFLPKNGEPRMLMPENSDPSMPTPGRSTPSMAMLVKGTIIRQDMYHLRDTQHLLLDGNKMPGGLKMIRGVIAMMTVIRLWRELDIRDTRP